MRGITSSSSHIHKRTTEEELNGPFNATGLTANKHCFKKEIVNQPQGNGLLVPCPYGHVSHTTSGPGADWDVDPVVKINQVTRRYWYMLHIQALCKLWRSSGK